MADEVPDRKVSLWDFIEKNQRLLTVLGVFTALTVFAGNVRIRALGYILGFFLFGISIVLLIEIVSRFESDERASGRLQSFQYLLMLSGIQLGLVWLFEYSEMWRAGFFQLMIMATLAIVPVFLLRSQLMRLDIHRKVRKFGGWRTALLNFLVLAATYVLLFYPAYYLSKVIAPPMWRGLVSLRQDFERIELSPQGKVVARGDSGSVRPDTVAKRQR